MQFKKGDTLAFVSNNNFPKIKLELLIAGSPIELASTANGELTISNDTFPIPLSTIESCIELLDAIRKPHLDYNRDWRIMMQNVIDNNAINAELVINQLKDVLPQQQKMVDTEGCKE